MRNAYVLSLNAGEPLEIRPPKAGRTYLRIENLDAATPITYAEDRVPALGIDAEIPPYAATNTANVREWGATGQAPDAVPQGAIWLTAALAIRVRITESAP